MAAFWEIAAHSVDHMFSMYFDYLRFSSFRFGFEGSIWVLIASVPSSVPSLCILLMFTLDLEVKDRIESDTNNMKQREPQGSHHHRTAYH